MPKTGTRKLIQHIENDLIKNNQNGKRCTFDLLRIMVYWLRKQKR
jgi:hypothetical protein